MARPVVISLHGIRTRGKWQKDLTRTLNEAELDHDPLDFGFFRAVAMLIPSIRRKKVQWFRDEYTRATQRSGVRPSVIAHSFGTYLVARALENFPEVVLDRVILCGSIIDVGYPWSVVIRERQQVTRVLNDHGHRDFWAKVVEWGVSDSGPSGVTGFTDLADGDVVQRSHPDFRHSDYFFELNYKHNWIPFLKGTDPPKLLNFPRRPTNWKFRSVVAAVLVAALVGALFFLRPHFVEVGGDVLKDNLNTTDPHWVYQNAPPSKTAVVFVHGIFGDTDETWTNENGTTFFDLLRSAPGMQGKLDIFAFGFTSKMFGGGSLDIREAANKLETILQFYGIWRYESVVFVAHSTGGLIVMQEVINHPEHRPRVPLLMLYATPTNGAEITRIANDVVGNPAIREMFLAEGNDFFRQLSEDWVGISEDRPKVTCAYEKKAINGHLIVPWSSATKFCDDVPDAIEGATHLTIVKPDRPEHLSVIVLVNALTKYVLGSANDALLDTPDFSAEGDHWIYTLTDPEGQNPARLRNIGARTLRYEVREISSEKLMVLPDEPQPIPAGHTDKILFVLMRGKIDSRYHLILRVPPLRDRSIMVNVPDIQAVQREQQALIHDMSSGISEYLSSTNSNSQ